MQQTRASGARVIHVRVRYRVFGAIAHAALVAWTPGAKHYWALYINVRARRGPLAEVVAVLGVRLDDCRLDGVARHAHDT